MGLHLLDRHLHRASRKTGLEISLNEGLLSRGRAMAAGHDLKRVVRQGIHAEPH